MNYVQSELCDSLMMIPNERNILNITNQMYILYWQHTHRKSLSSPSSLEFVNFYYNITIKINIEKRLEMKAINSKLFNLLLKK